MALAVTHAATATGSPLIGADDWNDAHTLTGEAAGAVPVGGIIMWSGTIATIPATWALCDGTLNAPGPDLRNRFIVGADADAGGLAKTTLTGGATQSGGNLAHIHTASGADVSAHSVTQPSAHVFTQASAHSAHVFTQPGAHDALTNNHVGSAVGTSAAGSAHTHTASGDHTSHTHDNHSVSAQPTIAWPAGVPTNAAHTHDNHGFTQPADHSALTNNHAGTAVGTSAAGSSHNHTIAGDAATTATGSSGAVKPTATHVHTMGAEAAHTHAAGTVTQPTAHGAISAHASGAVTPTTHSSIAPVIAWPAGVPTASGATVAPTTHSADSGTALSHGVLGNESTHTHAAGTVTQPTAHGAISAHAGGAVDAHSAHAGAGVDAHSGTAVSAHTITQPTIASTSAPQPYFALAFIQRLT